MQLKVLSLFSGIGAFEKALENLGIKIDLVGFSEIDKYAIKSYCAIHNVDESKNLGDITKIKTDNLPKDIDLLTHGSPCQDFSIAGKQAGGDENSGTRSSLMYETIRIIKDIKPKYVIWENVKNILSEQHRHNFDNYLKYMSEIGYYNYYKVLNAKDYEIPQNRERVYTISIRKDIKRLFYFPEKRPLKLRLKDMLEDEVDEKYYLSEKQINYIKNATYRKDKSIIQQKSYIDTLDCRHPKCVKVGELSGGKWDKTLDMNKKVYSDNGLCPTLTTMQGGNHEIKIVTRAPLKYLNRNQKNIEGDYAYCIDSSNTGGINENNRIRKLTPKECFRLQRIYR